MGNSDIWLIISKVKKDKSFDMVMKTSLFYSMLSIAFISNIMGFSERLLKEFPVSSGAISSDDPK